MLSKQITPGNGATPNEISNEPELSPTPGAGKPPDKPWPLSWILIAILLYVLVQTAWLAFN